MKTVNRNLTYYDTEAWGSLKKCWNGFIIAKSERNEDKMWYYAKGIIKFQKQLELEVRIFPDLVLWEIGNSELTNYLDSSTNQANCE